MDIYYYTLTWDKLRKVFDKFINKMNNILKQSNDLPFGFKDDFKVLKKRMGHLLNEFRIPVRDEYEHPSLQPTKINNLLEWGSIYNDNQGNIVTHVGKEEFAIVRKEHVERLNSLWIELVDIFLKHFTENPPSSSLLEAKKYIEDNFEEIINTCIQYRLEKKDKEANQILDQVLMSELYLSKEGVPLRQDIKDKLYSNFFPSRTEQPSDISKNTLGKE